METLLIGNTGYVTREFIINAFPNDSVVVIGNSKLKTDKQFHITSYHISMEDEIAEKIVTGHEFERIVYFSNHLTLHQRKQGEMERIRKIFHTYGINREAEIVYLTSLEGCYTENTGKTELVKDAEKLFLHYARTLDREVKIIRIPFLYSADYEDDYIYKLIKKMDEKKEVWFSELAEHHAYFLSTEDLSELLYRVFDLWDKKTEILNVLDSMQITFGELADCMKKLDEQLKVHYTGKSEDHMIPESSRELRKRYGWIQKYSILQELPGLYELFQQGKKSPLSKRNKIFAWMKEHDKIMKCIELFGGFLCLELLNKTVGNTVQFRMIDFRLLFVVLISSVYGMNMGIASAVLAGISLVLAYFENGTNGMTLFYEPMNWIPFIAYVTVAVICGYVRLRSKDKVKIANSQNKLLQEKFLTLRSMYLETVENQKYKKQIIGSRDSFGKIFEITKMLDVSEPQDIFGKAVQVMEEVLENKTIAVYSIRKNSKYGRLEVCSKGIENNLPKLISIEKYEQPIDVAKQGEVWTNTELLKNYPMYLAGIHGAEEQGLLIMVCRSSYEQKGLYYTNMIKILCGLIESSLLRAMKYQQIYESTVEKRGENEL